MEEGEFMKDLKKNIVNQIDKQLKISKPNIKYLDVLNKLLLTVASYQK